MQVCILGLPQSGKTTLFNALTRGKIETVPASHLTPNIGISKVQDPRLTILENIFKPKKKTLAEIKYIDIAAAAKTRAKEDGIYGPFLNYLNNADALIQVVRAFEDEKIPHVHGKLDPRRDAADMDLELIFSDLVIIERRLGRIELGLKAAKPSERENLLKEVTLLQRIKNALEKEVPIWKQGLTQEEISSLSNYQFLTAKPMLIVLNIGEEQIAKAMQIESDFRSIYSFKLFEVIAVCAKLEMELSQIDDLEAEDFRNSMGLKSSAIDLIISKSYSLLELISFFTVVSSELKAWTIRRYSTALEAAGKIHTDIQKGFIKAEVISYADLNKYGGVAEVKKAGLLRLEGKSYIVQDGDIITFLFNI